MRIIDVSHHQEVIDWEKVKQTDVNGVIVRVGYGKAHPDKQFVRNINEVIDRDFQYIGVYWFSYAYTVDMAINEAKAIMNLILPYRNRLNLGVYFDWEYDSMKNAKANGIIPDRELITNMTVAFCNYIEQQNLIAGYYINEDYTKQNLFDMNRLVKYRKWYARYSSKAKPVNTYLHQYTSTGTIKGIKTKVDINKFKSIPTVYETALQVIAGFYGIKDERKRRLEEAGYDYRMVQNVVNKILKGTFDGKG